MKSVEVLRRNISARQFYTYCVKQAEKKGMYPYVEYEDFEKPYLNEQYHENRYEDGRVEAIKSLPFDWLLTMSGSYKFIMEWDDNTGYMYIEEH